MIWEMAALRLRLLLRQKIFWMGLGLSAATVLLSVLFANISFAKPEKIFWDLSLGGAFVLQIFLATYLGAFLFNDEKEKRTLHWALSLDVSRAAWMGGNFLGMSVGLFCMALVSSIIIFFASFLFSVTPDMWLVCQTLVLTSVEAVVVMAMAFFLSLYVRPFLSQVFALILVLFLHSQDSLRLILLDPVSGRFVDNRGLGIILYVLRLFPPLQWFNLRDLVGYEGALEAAPFFGIFATGLIWIFVFLMFSKIRFERLDL